MKKLVLAALAVAVLGGTAAQAAIVVGVGVHHPVRHVRHRVCEFHHHHRVCFYR